MDKKKLDDFVKKVEDNTNDALEDTLLDKEASMEDTRCYSYDDIVKISTKDRISKLPWLISIFLILTISLAFGYMFFKGNPQTIFIKTVDDFFSFLNDNISDETYDISKSTISLDLNYSGYQMKSEKIDMDIEYTLDRANGLSKFKLDNDDLEIYGYSDKKNIYIYPKDVYDGYIKYSNVKTGNLIKIKDVKNILSGVNQAFDKVAADEKIVGEKVNYDLGNKTTKVYQSSLIINSKNYSRVSETFINTLKSNEEFVSALSSILNISSDDVKSRLDNYLPKLKKYLKDSGKTEIKLYTDRKNNSFLKGELICKDGNITITKNDDNMFTVNVNTGLLNGDFSIKLSKNKCMLDMNMNGLFNLNGNVSIVNKKLKSFGKVKMDKIIDEKELSKEDKDNIYRKIFGDGIYDKFIKDTDS